MNAIRPINTNRDTVIQRPCNRVNEALSSVWKYAKSAFEKPSQPTEQAENFRSKPWYTPSLKSLFVLSLLLGGAIFARSAERKPLISGGCHQITNIETDLGGGIKMFMAGGGCSITAGNGCDIITDNEWETVTPNEIQTFKELLKNGIKCDAVIKRLLEKPTKELREVAHNMGFDPELLSDIRLKRSSEFLSDSLDAEGLSIDRHNHVIVGSNYVYALNGWEDMYTTDEVRGGFAHEIAHRILKHHEKEVVAILEKLNISVESLDDIPEFLDALSSHCKGLPRPNMPASVSRLLQNFIEVAVGKSKNLEVIPNQMLGVYRKAKESLDPSFKRAREREADLLTLRNSQYTRGLMSIFKKHMTACNANPALRYLCEESDDHPSLANRIEQMRDALCQSNPAAHSDLCSELSLWGGNVSGAL
jgi:deoxyadenosine/deoxycytidine kinase